MPDIPIDLIAPPSAQVRRHGTTPDDDDMLLRSVAALGVLTPILVRPNGNDGYILVAGARRLRAADALGLKQIPAHVLVGFPQEKDRLAQAAENMARLPMGAVDQWRALAQLTDDGWTVAAAAAALCLSERQARQLEKLGRLHPDVLAQIERGDMPHEMHLAVIATAPPETQAAALKRAARGGADHSVAWHDVAAACGSHIIWRSRAIFDIDTAGVAFEEDLFAEGDADKDAWFTTDISGFLDAQAAALGAYVKAQQAAKKRIEIAVWKKSAVVLPKGFAFVYGNPDKLKKGETLFVAVALDGYRIGEIVKTIGAKPQTRAEAKAKAKPADDDEADEADAPPAKPPSPPPAAKAGEKTAHTITAAGTALIARAKTRALATALLGDAAEASLPGTDTILACLVLAFGSHTVSVKTGLSWGHMEVGSFGANLVPPQGVAGIDFAAAHRAAREILARVLVVRADDPLDPVPEWIGQLIRADAALPRFDTEEMLQHVSGAEMKRIAAAAGLKPASTTAGLRAQLVGHAPNWRPSIFGAPGPQGAST